MKALVLAAMAALGAASAVQARPLEDAVLKELNFARTHPAGYAERLRAYRAQFRGRVWIDPATGRQLMTNEGVRAVDEAIAVMERTAPMPAVEASAALTRAAFDHARDQGPMGAVGHIGSDRSRPESRINRYGSWIATMAETISYGEASPEGVVRQLIVDDGVYDRAHRVSVLNPALKVAGVGCGVHAAYRAMCVVDFAGGMGKKKPDGPQGVSYYSYAAR